MKIGIYKYKGTSGTLERNETFDFPDSDPPKEMFFHQESLFIDNVDINKASINISRMVVVNKLELIEVKNG